MKLTLFHLNNCPYCQNARQAMAELVKEDPAYSQIEIDWIEESRQPEVAERYDYYYVPTIYLGEDKLYEARPSESYADCKRNVKAALDTALANS